MKRIFKAIISFLVLMVLIFFLNLFTQKEMVTRQYFIHNDNYDESIKQCFSSCNDYPLHLYNISLTDKDTGFTYQTDICICIKEYETFQKTSLDLRKEFYKDNPNNSVSEIYLNSDVIK